MNKELINQICWSLPYNGRRILHRFYKPKEFRRLNDLRSIAPEKINSPTFKPFLQHRCIFVHIPKVAGISIGYSLFGRHTGNHTTIAEYQIAFNKKEFDSFFKFAFVRNPWDRVLSAFLFLKSGGRNQNDLNWSQQHLSQFDSFTDFVSVWLNRENVSKGVHFKPQYEFVTLPTKQNIEVDFVGYYENIAEDFNYIRNRLGIGKPLEFSNKTKSKQKDYHSYYNDKAREIVADVYREDIELFGYDFDGILIKNIFNRRND